MLTCSILQNFYRIDSIIIPVSHIKKLSRLEEVGGFVQGQAASNCQKKKLRNNTIHPTTSKLPLTTDKRSIKRATVDPNL